MPDLPSPGVFLSYRRDDGAPYARLLRFQLQERVPHAPVFMDLDSIEAGLDFAEVIDRAVRSCAVLIAIIGRQWVTVADRNGLRRLDDPNDYVRFELETAFECGIRIVPVLVDGAEPLRQEQLPNGLARLARLNALDLSHGRYEYDASRLLDLVERILAQRTSAHNDAGQDDAVRSAELLSGVAGQQGVAQTASATEKLPRPHARRSDFLLLDFVGVRAEESTEQPMLLLKERGSDRFLLIKCTAIEATEAAFVQQGLVPSRPMTYDLFRDVLAATQIELVSTDITTLRDGVVYSELTFPGDVRVSSRTPDAINLAIRIGAPIRALAEILDEASVAVSGEQEETFRAASAHFNQYLVFNQNLPGSSATSTTTASWSVNRLAPPTALMIEMELVGVRVEQRTSQPILLLKEIGADRFLPIWCGPVEAQALAFAQQGSHSDPPPIHDLLASVLKTVNVRLLNADITSLRDGIYFSELVLIGGIRVSARPSDAVNLAIRTDAKIRVHSEILDEGGVSIPAS